MTRNTAVPPTRGEADRHGDATWTHPAFACVGVSRVSGRAGAGELFDSQVSHQHYVRLEVTSAEYQVGPYHSRVMGRSRPYIVLEMTEAQWVAMVSRMNGPDVPCTLRRVTDGLLKAVPEIAPMPKFEEALTNDAAAMHAKWNADIDRCRAEILTIADKLGARSKAELESVLSRMVGHLKANSHFAHEVLTERKERLVTEAGLELESMANALVNRLGLQSVEHLGSLLAADSAVLKQLTHSPDGERDAASGVP